MATKTYLGLAEFAGCAGTFDVILYGKQQTMSMSHKFETESIKDEFGQTASMRGQDEAIDGDINFKLVADTFAHATSAAAFLAPLTVVTISQNGTNPIPAAWVGKWILMTGSKIDTKNDAVGDISFKLMRFVDSTQNTAMTTTPS